MEIGAARSKLDKAFQENRKLKDMFNPDQLVEAMTKVVSTMTVKEKPKHPRALNTKVHLAMLVGSNSPSWHVVLMGCWSST